MFMFPPSSEALPPVVSGPRGADGCCCQGKSTLNGSDIHTLTQRDTKPPGVNRIFQAAYDKVCAAKKQAEERNRKLDDKRKKIKQGECLCFFSFLFLFFYLMIT